ncbi:arginase family protein [Listeria sp. PSOL-1]|uniref:arginase family protein n=1 Tax=Listeria sp. PSOL-1 TaxID=1844999 RepID=UPI0013D6C6A2|nr:arginase family protein [Listeria sp. PSOL-1]
MKKTGILGVPWLFNQARRGTLLAPFAIRYAGMDEFLARLDIHVNNDQNLPFFTNLEEEAILINKNLEAITKKIVELKQIVCEMLEKEGVPIILGGEQFISLGVIAAALVKAPKAGVVWLNAELDLGNEHYSERLSESVLEVALGRGTEILTQVMDGHFLDPGNLAIIGTRRCSKTSKAHIDNLKINHYEMQTIDRKGFQKVTDELMEWIKIKKQPIHFMLAVNVIDPEFAPGTDIISVGGLYWREIRHLLKKLADSHAVASITITGLNPLKDEKNKTARLIATLLEEYFTG